MRKPIFNQQGQLIAVKDHVEGQPDKVTVFLASTPTRVLVDYPITQQLKEMRDLSNRRGKEVGALVLKQNGEFILSGHQLGERAEIVFDQIPSTAIGSVHSHLHSTEFSQSDIDSFLGSDWERVMILLTPLDGLLLYKKTSDGITTYSGMIGSTLKRTAGAVDRMQGNLSDLIEDIEPQTKTQTAVKKSRKNSKIIIQI